MLLLPLSSILHAYSPTTVSSGSPSEGMLSLKPVSGSYGSSRAVMLPLF